jgi:hypothetical protein
MYGVLRLEARVNRTGRVGWGGSIGEVADGTKAVRTTGSTEGERAEQLSSVKGGDAQLAI